MNKYASLLGICFLLSCSCLGRCLETWPGHAAYIGPDNVDTILFDYRMTCFVDEVGCDTMIMGADTTITVTSLAGPISPSGLVIYFPFGSGFGNASKVFDMSGFGNDGLICNDLALTGDRCVNTTGAAFFDAGCVKVPHSDRFSSPDLTVSFWFKKTPDDVDCFEKVLEKGPPGERTISFEIKNTHLTNCPPANSAFPWNLQMNNATDELGSDTDELHLVDIVFPDTFHFVTGTVQYLPDIDSTLRKLYYNGVLGISEMVKGKTKFNAQDITIGSRADLTRPFKGAIDELRLYNRVLSPDEILILYEHGCSFCTTYYIHETTCDPAKVSQGPSSAVYVGGDSLVAVVKGLKLPAGVGNQGLIGYFPMGSYLYDEPGKIRDMSGFGNHGIMNGAVAPGADQCGNPTGAYLFFGESNFVEIPHHPVWEEIDTLSIACWFKKNNDSINDANDDDLEGLIAKAQRTGCTATPVFESRTFTLAIQDPNQGNGTSPPFNLELKASNGQDCFVGNMPGAVVPGEWVHIVGILKPGISEIYVNNVGPLQWDLPGGLHPTPHNIFFGKPANHLTDATNRFFNGSLDNVLFFNRQLALDEIAALANPCLVALDTTLCFGESIVMKNGTYSAPATGIIDTLLTTDGCDSIQVYLTILEKKERYFHDMICENLDTLLFDSAHFCGDDTLSFLLPGAGWLGCDSTVKVLLSCLPVYEIELF